MCVKQVLAKSIQIATFQPEASVTGMLLTGYCRHSVDVSSRSSKQAGVTWQVALPAQHGWRTGSAGTYGVMQPSGLSSGIQHGAQTWLCSQPIQLHSADHTPAGFAHNTASGILDRLHYKCTQANTTLTMQPVTLHQPGESHRPSHRRRPLQDAVPAAKECTHKQHIALYDVPTALCDQVCGPLCLAQDLHQSLQGKNTHMSTTQTEPHLHPPGESHRPSHWRRPLKHAVPGAKECTHKLHIAFDDVPAALCEVVCRPHRSKRQHLAGCATVDVNGLKHSECSVCADQAL